MFLSQVNQVDALPRLVSESESEKRTAVVLLRVDHRTFRSGINCDNHLKEMIPFVNKGSRIEDIRGLALEKRLQYLVSTVLAGSLGLLTS